MLPARLSRLATQHQQPDCITPPRCAAQGKGDFSMEYKAHVAVPQHMQEEMIEELNRERAEREANL